MNKFIDLKKQLMLLDPFIRLKRLKEILVYIKSKQYRQELIEIARITIYQLNQVREGEFRSTLDNKISITSEDISDEKIERTIEEIAEEETNLGKNEEKKLTDPFYGSSKNQPSEDFYGRITEENKVLDFYNSSEPESFYESPEDDKKEKRLYF